MVLSVALQLPVAVGQRLARPDLGGHEEERPLGHHRSAQHDEEGEEVHEHLEENNQKRQKSLF